LEAAGAPPPPPPALVVVVVVVVVVVAVRVRVVVAVVRVAWPVRVRHAAEPQDERAEQVDANARAGHDEVHEPLVVRVVVGHDERGDHFEQHVEGQRQQAAQVGEAAEELGARVAVRVLV